MVVAVVIVDMVVVTMVEREVDRLAYLVREIE